jgi:hypothetical protein
VRVIKDSTMIRVMSHVMPGGGLKETLTGCRAPRRGRPLRAVVMSERCTGRRCRPIDGPVALREEVVQQGSSTSWERTKILDGIGEGKKVPCRRAGMS